MPTEKLLNEHKGPVVRIICPIRGMNNEQYTLLKLLKITVEYKAGRVDANEGFRRMLIALEEFEKKEMLSHE